MKKQEENIQNEVKKMGEFSICKKERVEYPKRFESGIRIFYMGKKEEENLPK